MLCYTNMVSKTKEEHLIRVKNGTHTRLNKLKYDLKMKSVSDTIAYLIKCYEKTRKKDTK